MKAKNKNNLKYDILCVCQKTVLQIMSFQDSILDFKN